MWRYADIKTLADIPRIYAAEKPNNTALIDPSGEVSFAELEQRTRTFARVLRAAGVAPDSHIGFIGKNSILYFEVLFGASRAGCATLPLNWRLAVPELAAVMKDAQVRYVVADREFLEIAQQAKALSDLDFILVEADSERSGTSELDRLAEESENQEDVCPEVSPDKTAILIYTSGTTGQPKGATLPRD